MNQSKVKTSYNFLLFILCILSLLISILAIWMTTVDDPVPEQITDNSSNEIENQKWELYAKSTDMLIDATNRMNRVQMYNAMNQYYFTADTTCEDIINRLQENKRIMDNLETFNNDVLNVDGSSYNFKTFIDGMLEANEGNDAFIRQVERVEYCLTK